MVRLPQGGAIPQLGQGECNAGFALGAGRERRFQPQCGAPRVNQRRPKEPVSRQHPPRTRAHTEAGCDPIGPVARGVAHRRLARPGRAGREDRGERDRDSQPPAGNPRGHQAPGGAWWTGDVKHHDTPRSPDGRGGNDKRPEARPGRVRAGLPALGVGPKGLISEPGLPGRSRPGGPTAIRFLLLRTFRYPEWNKSGICNGEAHRARGHAAAWSCGPTSRPPPPAAPRGRVAKRRTPSSVTRPSPPGDSALREEGLERRQVATGLANQFLTEAR